MTTQVILLFSLLAVGYATQAQNSPPETLSWDQCRQEALVNNPALKAAAERLESSDANVKGARSGFFPQITGSLTYGRDNNLQDDGTDSYGATLNLNQNLFSGFQDQAKIDAARAARLGSEAALETTRAKVVADLKGAFSALVFAQNLVTLQEQIIKRRDENFNLINLRFKSGRENRGSVLLSKAYADQAELDLLQANNSVETARTDLARVLGRDPAALTLTGEVPLTPLATTPPDFRGLASITPDIKQSRADLESADATLKSARSGFFPQLGLSASSGRQGEYFFPGRDHWSVGASLSFPLFNGGRDYYAAQSATSAIQAARATLDNVTRDKITQLRSAYYAYLEGMQKVKVDRGFREAASTRAEIARAKYNNGLMSFDDWDVVENDLISRQRAVLQSERDLVSKEATWLALQGKGT